MDSIVAAGLDMRLGDVTPFGYLETVFVRGKLPRYVEDLEKYFREAWQYHAGRLHSLKRYLDRARGAQKMLKQDGFFLMDDDGEYYGCPFPVDEENSRMALSWLEQQTAFKQDVVTSLRINDRLLQDIHSGRVPPETLNVTNYAHYRHIIRIKQVPGAIRMRVFVDGRQEGVDSKSRAFAEHAASIPGVEAECVKEGDVDDVLEPVQVYVAGGAHAARPLVLPELVYDVREEGDMMRYSFPVSPVEQELLRKFGPTQKAFEKPVYLMWASSSWSPYQGNRLLHRLFGIIAISARPGYREDGWYESVFVPEENRQTVRQALNTGVFSKRVPKCSLAAMVEMEARTTELQARYGVRFHPRFSPEEVGRSMGKSPEEAGQMMKDLTGVAARIDHTHHFKNNRYVVRTDVSRWFLPSGRRQLVEKLVAC